MVTDPVSRENSGEGGMKKRGIWVKVKPAVGLYHLRFDVSRFTDKSRADLTPVLTNWFCEKDIPSPKAPPVDILRWPTSGISWKFLAIICLFSIIILASGLKRSFADTTQAKATANSINSFALDLYGKIRSQEGNLAFSPYSVSMALGMAYSGARGTTESQMAVALHLNLPQAKVSKAFAEVTSQILSAGKEKTVEINVANALWAEKSYPFLKEYLESVKAYSDQQGWFSWFWDRGALRQLDFIHDADASRKTINKWVEDQTKDKIKDLLAPGDVNDLTRLVLTSAIYFCGEWEKQFSKELTKDDNFTMLNGSTKMVPMMHQEASFGYAEESGLQVLEMQYKAPDLSMVVLLPSKDQPFKDFEQSITSEKLDKWTGGLQWKKVEVFLPKFEMTSHLDLTQPLIDLGMKHAFTNADFSGMTGNRDLFISKVLHKAFVGTNEQGTEAAAATAVIMKTGRDALNGLPSVPIFRADHPFLFLIRHRPSNCILFLGRVSDPPSK